MTHLFRVGNFKTGDVVVIKPGVHIRFEHSLIWEASIRNSRLTIVYFILPSFSVYNYTVAVVDSPVGIFEINLSHLEHYREPSVMTTFKVGDKVVYKRGVTIRSDLPNVYAHLVFTVTHLEFDCVTLALNGRQSHHENIRAIEHAQKQIQQEKTMKFEIVGEKPKEHNKVKFSMVIDEGKENELPCNNVSKPIKGYIDRFNEVEKQVKNLASIQRVHCLEGHVQRQRDILDNFESRITSIEDKLDGIGKLFEAYAKTVGIKLD